MAKQDAVRSGLGYRDPKTGLATIDHRIGFEVADAEIDASEEDLLEGDALAILVVHGRGAESFARNQRAVSIDVRERRRWQSIIRIIEALRQEIRAGATPAGM